MAACIDIREDLKAYVDGELANGRKSAVRSHVEGCAACSRELTEIERYSNTLRALDNAEPRPELRRRILASLPDDPAPVRRGINWLFPAYAGAALAAAVLGFIFFKPVTSPPAATDRQTRLAGKATPPGENKAAVKEHDKIARIEAYHPQVTGKPEGSKSQAQQPSKPVQRGPQLMPQTDVAAAIKNPVKTPSTAASPEGLPDLDTTKRNKISLRSPGSKLEEPVFRAPAEKPVDQLAKNHLERSNAPAGTEQKQPIGEAASTLSLGVPAFKKAADSDGTLVLMVDNLDSGLASVQTLAKEQGGTSQVLQRQEPAQGINVQVVLPADRVEALKSKLSEGNTLRYFNVQNQAGYQFGFQEQTNGAAFGRGGGGGFGGFNGGGRAPAPAGPPPAAGLGTGGVRGMVKGQIDKRDSQAAGGQQNVAGKNVQQESIENRARKGAAPAQQNATDRIHATKNDVQLRNDTQLKQQNAKLGGVRDSVKDEYNNARMLKASAQTRGGVAAPMFRLNIQLQQNPKIDTKSGGKAGN